jgi:hypothetical protein
VRMRSSMATTTKVTSMVATINLRNNNDNDNGGRQLLLFKTI